MLPATPLHHLLMAAMPGPIVATSGNLSDEPICIDNAEAISRLGDMETPQARAAFEHLTADFLRLYDAEPEVIVHDLHPDYPTTHWAQSPLLDAPEAMDLSGLPKIAVQHHHAHLASCLAENGLEDQVCLGITWDGTGYGTDGTIWGGEFLIGDASEFQGVAHLRSFRLPGGEAAIHEPRRSALSLLLEAGLDPDVLLDLALFTREELRLLESLVRRGFHAPLTTSAGRLFDGVACLVGLRPSVSFEAQAAIELEQIIDVNENGSYRIELVDGDGESPWTLDWAPMIEEVLRDSRHNVSPAIMATRFHRALADASVTVAKRVGVSRIALTGGCFQNRFLTEYTRQRLQNAGFQVLLHREVPANDGGISLGQIAVAGKIVRIDPGVEIDARRVRTGDVVIVSGAIADHGIAIMSVREGLEFETELVSDSACLVSLVAAVLAAAGSRVHVLRDPTRGGVASALNEIAGQAQLAIRIDERKIPLHEQVRGACEILGFDPLYVANEGKFLAIVAPEGADTVLAVMQAHQLGREAAILGEVVDGPPGRVVLESRIGGERIVDMLSGEQLPRIC